jgi:hypothetical protein
MDKTNQYFNDLFTSWTQVQKQAWQAQARLFEDASASFAKSFESTGDGAGVSAGGNAGEAAGCAESAAADLNGLFDSIWSKTQQTFESWSQYLESLAPDGSDGVLGAEVLARLMDPGAWLNLGINELNQNIELLAEGAKFADMWSAERGALHASREWLDLRRHSLRYRYVIIGAWMRAFDRFSARVKQDFTTKDGPKMDLQALIPAWLEIANEELLKTQRSAEFLEAQRDLLRASIDFRARQQRFVEQMCEAQAIPTRTEVDDLHRTVTELRREMRTLRAEIARLRGANVAPAGDPRLSRRAPGVTPKVASRTPKAGQDGTGKPERSS